MQRIFLGVIFLLAAGVMCWADELVLSTYYPAPNGVYVNLRASRLALGATQASMDGDIVLAEHSTAISTWGPGIAGELAYHTTEGLMVSNGSAWAVEQGKALLRLKGRL